MTSKTVSLKTAQELKAAGFPYRPSFAYCLHAITGGPDYVHLVWDGQGLTSCGSQYLKVYAPTSDEILEELPDDDWLTIQKANGLYCVMYTQYGQPKPYFENASLAEALSAMWLYLKQQGLLEAKT